MKRVKLTQTQTIVNTKTYLILVFLLTMSKGLFAQTLTLSSDAPSNTICRGDVIQVNLDITPPNGATGYNWTNVTTGQFIKGENGNAGTFHQFTGADRLLTNTTIRVEAFGGTGGNLSETIDIIVQQPANPGTEGSLLLCNKTGDVDLFTLLQGGPDTGGTWDPPLANGDRGTFTIGTDAPGVYRYLVSATSPCSDSESRVVVKECFNDDFDNDGVPNATDLDDDNDGILDADENAACTPATLTESSPVVDIDFGTGDTPTTDPNIIGHQHNPNWPDDGFYNVATSLYMFNSANFDVWFVTTDQNPIPHSDGGGDTNGRFLAVNIASNFGNQVLYELKDIPISAGIEYNFRIDMVGLCDQGCAHVPALDLEIIDQNSGATILTTTSAALGVANDDIWRTLLDKITVPTNTFLTLRIRNQQLQGSNGNDMGIDNIRFAPLECDTDRDEVPNFLDLDSDNDGIFDIVEAGRGDLDANNDGIVDGIIDTDGDGIADVGVDANGVPLAVAGKLTPINSDTDTVPDYLDIDSDNDGIQDNIEGQPTATYIAPSGNDFDKNGVDDAYEGTGAISPVDTDADTIPDYLDVNSDDDCLSDTIEAHDLNQDGIADIVPAGGDTDNDGLDNAFDTVPLDATTAVTNPTDGGELPTDLPDNHNPNTPDPPGNDVDFREAFTEIDEKKTAGGCASGIPTINLFDSLELAAIPGGTWTGPSALTGGELGTFSATTNVAGVYTYTLPIIGACPPRKGEVTVSIVNVPVSGTDGTLNTCISAAPTSLFTRIGGTPDPGGSWTDPNGDPFGTTDQGVLDPSVMGALSGTYTYTLGVTGCSQSVDVEVTINTGANAGDDDTVSFCSTDSTSDLFDSLGTTPDVGGSWTDPNGNPFGTTDRGTIDPSDPTTLAGDYTYTVSTTTCPTPDSAVITVAIETTPNLAFDGTTCSDDRDSYSVSFITNGTWTITIDPPSAGTIDAANARITDIAAGTNFSITASNPANTTCEDILDIIAPDCTCPDIAEPTSPTNQRICVGSPNPALSVTVLTGQTANWYAPDGTLLAENTTTYTPTETAVGNYSYSVEAFDTTEKCPSDRINVSFDIVTAPQVELANENVICVTENGIPRPDNDFPFIDTFLDPSDFTFVWSFEGTIIPGQTSSGIETLLPGTYTVTYTDIVSTCSDTASVTINASRGPQSLELSLSSGSFAESNDIIATVVGDGAHEFSLDNGSFQSDNVFRNVALGLHQVIVRDVNGCGTLTEDIFVIGFPNFFTPNNDGFNDTWNVIADENLPEMIIYIFDRYGKLLKQLDPKGSGWDGIYNGEVLPSTDYWFTAQLEDGSQTYRSHFTLKR